MVYRLPGAATVGVPHVGVAFPLQSPRWAMACTVRGEHFRTSATSCAFQSSSTPFTVRDGQDLVGLLSTYVPDDERIITIEDAPELRQE